MSSRYASSFLDLNNSLLIASSTTKHHVISLPHHLPDARSVASSHKELRRSAVQVSHRPLSMASREIKSKTLDSVDRKNCCFRVCLR